jgi:hypothetical protein
MPEIVAKVYTESKNDQNYGRKEQHVLTFGDLFLGISFSASAGG